MIPVDDGSGQAVPRAPAVGAWQGRKISREAEVLAAGILIIAGAFLYPYLDRLAGSLLPGCLFRNITGVPCLLCGMTRSFVAIAHGHLGEAFRLHLLGPPLFMVSVVVTAMLAAEFALSRRILPRPDKRTWKYIAWGTLGLLSAAWIVRLVFFGINV